MKKFKDILLKGGLSAIKLGLAPPPAIETIIERFLAENQLRTLLKRLGINCVIDVGANTGQYAKRLRMMGYDGHIMSIEPIHDHFLSIHRESQNDPKWQCFNYALGSINETRQFNITQSTVYSSFLKPTTEAVKKIVDVDIKRLDSVFDDLIATVENPRVFLKMDTQGFDVEAVKGAEGCLTEISGLQSELSVSPIYEGMPHYLDALKYYETLDFSLMNLAIVNRTHSGAILEYDCLMARINKLTDR